MREKVAYRISWVLVIIVGLTIFACQSTKEVSGETVAVCIWDRTAVRAEPKDSSKWLASLKLGEVVIWSGKTAVDSTSKREYMEITLSDGKTGWAKTDLLVPNAQVGVIKESTPIYQRPDLLTLSDKSLEMMDMVAVTDTAEIWFQVIGKERRKKGWIRTHTVIFDKDEVTVAILAKQALDDAGDEPLSEIVTQLREELPFPNSYFLKKLEEQASEEADNSEDYSESEMEY